MADIIIHTERGHAGILLNLVRDEIEQIWIGRGDFTEPARHSVLSELHRLAFDIATALPVAGTLSAEDVSEIDAEAEVKDWYERQIAPFDVPEPPVSAPGS